MSIWSRAVWKSYWLALQRIRHDKRARAHSLRITYIAVVIVGETVYILYTGANRWQAIFYAFIFGTGIIAAILIRRWQRKQNEFLNFSLTGQTRVTSQAPAVPCQVQAYLRERALILASLMVRAEGEIYLRQGLPVSCPPRRQIQNAFLRDRGLWLKLEGPEQRLAALADGNWTAVDINSVTQWCEQLRLLRWVLRVDTEIVPLAHAPKLDFSLSRELLTPDIAAFPGKAPALNAWDVRVERDIANAYTARVVAELSARKLIPDSPELSAWAGEFRAKSIGPSTDYLAGSKTIAELDDNALRALGSFASARRQYARYLVEQLSSSEVIPFSECQT